MKKLWEYKKIKALGVVATLISCITIAGISAYFTDKDSQTSTFTVGKISLSIEGDKWKENNAVNITPKQEVAKNPHILNNGVNEEYVFLEVVVPYANVKTSNEDGSINSAKDVQLFTWNVNNGWKQVGTVSDDKTNKTYTYVYGYTGTDTSSMEALEKDTTTHTLFDYVRFANVVDGEGLEEKSWNIVINAYGIQTDNLYDNDLDVDGKNDDGVVSPTDVWGILTANQG